MNKKSQPEPEKKKRGNYKQKECPYCHAHVGNLGNHIRLKHPAEAPPPPEPTKESLLSGKQPPESLQPGGVIYYCTGQDGDCRAEVRKGETQCWKCGEILVWDGIE